MVKNYETFLAQGQELRKFDFREVWGPVIIDKSERHLSPDSEVVRGWLANPETYPEELRRLQPVLWGSLKFEDRGATEGTSASVKMIEWIGKPRLAEWYVSVGFGESNPALLEPALA